MSPESRGTGIGQTLAKFIAFTARQRELDLVDVSSGRRPERDAVHGFYAALGFVDASSTSIGVVPDLVVQG